MHKQALLFLSLTLLLGSCAEPLSEPAEVVAAQLGDNSLNIQSRQLRTTPNPKGDGEYVYVLRTLYNGVERYIVWMVIDGKAFAMNSPTKSVIPSIPFPRDAPPEVWERTGSVDTRDALADVFGK